MFTLLTLQQKELVAKLNSNLAAKVKWRMSCVTFTMMAQQELDSTSVCYVTKRNRHQLFCFPLSENTGKLRYSIVVLSNKSVDPFDHVSLGYFENIMTKFIINERQDA